MNSLDTTGLSAGSVASSSYGMTAMRATSLGCTKLRGSCHSCASSKIKCTKEKPSCSKCTSRGIDCQYSYARRPGRRRENSPGHPNSCTSKHDTIAVSTNEPTAAPSTIPNSTTIPITDSSFSSSSSIIVATPNVDSGRQGNLLRSGDIIEVREVSPSSILASNNTIPVASVEGANDFPDASSSITISGSLLFNNTLQTYSPDPPSMFTNGIDMFSHLPDLELDINDMDFVISDTFFDYPAMDDKGNGIGSLLTANESIDFNVGTSGVGHLTRNSSTASSGPSSGLPSLSSGAPTSFTARSSVAPVATTDLPCGCITQALGLLQTLSSAYSPLISTYAASDMMPSSTVTEVRFPKAVVPEIKQNIEAVASMLTCPSCAEDSFLLTVLSMAMLKIVERCAAEAQPRLYNTGEGRATFDAVPRLAHSIVTSSNYHMRSSSRADSDDGADSRIPVQLILGELHCAKVLVNEMSSKLNSPSDMSAGGVGLETGGSIQAAEETGTTVHARFPHGTLAQMETDLRKSLVSLSEDMMDLLS